MHSKQARKYWAKLEVPATPSCNKSATELKFIDDAFKLVPESLGTKASGVPASVAEDGRFAERDCAMTAAAAKAAYGLGARPQVAQVPAY